MNELKDLIRTNFKRYRLQSKLSQVELAKLLEVRPSAISNWESGRNSIDIDTLFKVCKIYGISINEMVGEPPKEEPKEDPAPSTDYLAEMDTKELLIEAVKTMSEEDVFMLMRYYTQMNLRRMARENKLNSHQSARHSVNLQST